MLSSVVGDFFLPAGKDMLSRSTIRCIPAPGTRKPRDCDRNSNRYPHRFEFNLTPCLINKNPNSNQPITTLFEGPRTRLVRSPRAGSPGEFPQSVAMNVNAAFTRYSQWPTSLGASVQQGNAGFARAGGVHSLGRGEGWRPKYQF